MAVKKKAINTPPVENMESFLAHVFEKGYLPKDALDMSEEAIESVYAHAYRLYQAGKYTDAGGVFRILITLNPIEPKYYLGLAASLHRLKHYETACVMYEFSAELNPHDPMPLYYDYDCKMHLNQVPEAIECLKEVIARGAGKPEYEAIVDRAKLTLAGLETAQ